MGVNITTIVYLRVLIIQIGSTIILMVVEAQGNVTLKEHLQKIGTWIAIPFHRNPGICELIKTCYNQWLLGGENGSDRNQL